MGIPLAMIFKHRPRASLAQFTFCRWHHNRWMMTPPWPDKCDAFTWKVISKSLDIDFIHGDINDRPCKNVSICTHFQCFQKFAVSLPIDGLLALTKHPKFALLIKSTANDVKRALMRFWLTRVLLPFHAAYRCVILLPRAYFSNMKQRESQRE